MLIDFIDKRSANVYGIYGGLGGGKTMTAVELCISFLRMGWDVASNVRLYNLGNLAARYKFIDDFATVDYWSLPVGAPRGSDDPHRSVIVIDEVAEFFDQWSSASLQLKHFSSWLRHSSKRGQFVFLIVQKPEFIAKSLRLLISKWIVCWDMDQARLPVFKIKWPFLSGCISRHVFDRSGNRISSGLNLTHKKYWAYYYSTAQNLARPDEAQFSAAPWRLSPWFFKGIILALLYFLYIYFWF